ncbi:MAG TPA: hypothetical protein VFN41_07140 [Candidatus Limnocylindrales bacterium]|nr:hypothetical protein [Candidatus Limnocylindrales bacterium]
MTSSINLRARALGVAAIALVAAGCGATPAASGPAASAAASSSVSPMATPSSESSVEASPSVSASAPSAASATAGASISTTGRIAIPDHRFAVTLPDGWTRIDLEAQDIDALIEAAGAQNPDLAKVYTQQIRAMAAQGLVLFAFGPDMTKGTNLNVLSTSNMGLSLDFLEQANLAQVKALANGAITSERVQLPAGEALHLRYALSTATGAPSPTIEQYLLINGDKQLVVSLTNASQAEASAIAKSIELLS